MSSFGLGGAPHPDAGKRTSVSSGVPDFDSQMQSLLDAPIPNDQDKKKGKKKGKKKAEGQDQVPKGHSSAGDLLGLEDSADVNTGGADISMEQSSDSLYRPTQGTAAATMDALSKITGEGALEKSDNFDIDELLPSGPSSNPKPKASSTPTTAAAANSGASSYGSTSPLGGGGYKPSVGRNRRASALPSSSTLGSSNSRSGVRRHSSVTSAGLDQGKIASLSKYAASKKTSESDSDLDSDDSDNDTNASGGRLSPRATGSSLGARNSSKNSPPKDKALVTSLEKQIASLRSEKEALIRQHASEMASVRHNPSAERELSDLRSKLRSAEEKSGSLTNEVAKLQLKQAEDRTVSQAKFNELVDEMRRKNDEERRSMMKSHDDGVAQMKKTHIEEIGNVKQRSADAQVMESLASQIKQSAATLKILENQMITSKMATDAGRESQLEARERLIGDIERSSRESMERSESQAVRLQGSVGAVEDVMRSLRNQNVEERERLKGEHARLESMQAGLMQERAQFLAVNEEERSRIADRWASFEVEKRKMEENLAIRREDVERGRAKLEREKAEFARLQGEASRAAEAQVEEMSKEEKRLNDARGALMRDLSLFEQKQEAAKQDLLLAESSRLELDALRGKLDEDKRRLGSMGEELHKLGQEVHQRGNEAENKLSEAEKIKAEGINAQRTALAAKNQIDVERTRLGEEKKRAEAERVGIAHERMMLIRDQTNNRQLNMKLSSAVTVSKTTGGQAAWGPVGVNHHAPVGGVGVGRPFNANSGESRANIYNREMLSMLRKQVVDLGAGEGGGCGGLGRSYAERSEFLDDEENFMNSVRKSAGVGGKIDSSLQASDF
ncbi:hypothetical protein TrLO_g3324 [Triparma laevis f. longispina]|uniref:Uncharacterized protein n=1 Tax=Triparma laevis f. longispina TaxID=1714387 RepID=A0A9W7FPZ8_9STRA|nr:hypothetical protein TrLO_g3324 [Triparma laevis f. longispina]